MLENSTTLLYSPTLFTHARELHYTPLLSNSVYPSLRTPLHSFTLQLCLPMLENSTTLLYSPTLFTHARELHYTPLLSNYVYPYLRTPLHSFTVQQGRNPTFRVIRNG
ncbi:hypothetical protein RRG08_050544 [Elysia crispata]|uniref:Uncharacterized protein n=1 Tax=Elysia crispata TaxID=231223 RepID=A0AAE0YZW8_9GAST|nr:hypothetical protein RRG08_050544 [Elysia crispata]